MSQTCTDRSEFYNLFYHLGLSQKQQKQQEHRRNTSSGGGRSSSPLASVDRAVPHRCCSESSCLLLLCLQRPTQATQNGHPPATQAQPGTIQATQTL